MHIGHTHTHTPSHTITYTSPNSVGNAEGLLEQTPSLTRASKALWWNQIKHVVVWCTPTVWFKEVHNQTHSGNKAVIRCKLYMWILHADLMSYSLTHQIIKYLCSHASDVIIFHCNDHDFNSSYWLNKQQATWMPCLNGSFDQSDDWVLCVCVLRGCAGSHLAAWGHERLGAEQRVWPFCYPTPCLPCSTGTGVPCSPSTPYSPWAQLQHSDVMGRKDVCFPLWGVCVCDGFVCGRGKSRLRVMEPREREW